MPIRIDKIDADNVTTIEWLCEDIWAISPLLYELEHWLKEKGSNLSSGEYVADLGISCVTPSATGGGGVLSLEAIQMMAQLGMELWISEYDAGASQVT